LLFSLDDLQPLRGALLLAVPMLYLVAAVLASWRVARVCTTLAVGLTAASLAWLALSSPLIIHGLRADAPGCIVLLLVSFIGWVITRYSQTYMGGDAGQAAVQARPSGGNAAGGAILDQRRRDACHRVGQGDGAA